jgi:hypothetical protein
MGSPVRVGLTFLEFDITDNADGHIVLEAMASVAPPRLAALHAEVAQVLRWAHAQFPGQCAPLDDGGEWDVDLHSQREWVQPELLRFDAAHGRLLVHVDGLERPDATTEGAAVVLRHTVTVAITGTAAFGEAFCAAFDLS